MLAGAGLISTHAIVTPSDLKLPLAGFFLELFGDLMQQAGNLRIAGDGSQTCCDFSTATKIGGLLRHIRCNRLVSAA